MRSILLSKSELIEFEEDIAREFEAGNIRAPIHLSGGNEDQLIDIFSEVRPEHYCLSTWRSHYHALLKGIPREEVKRQIMAGKSMHISSTEHRFLSSSIMGGILPIACGLAVSETVWCFVGDMAASTGGFADATRYSHGYGLDVRWVVEDNGLSVGTPTRNAWGMGIPNHARIGGYKFKLSWPHSGARKWVAF